MWEDRGPSAHGTSPEASQKPAGTSLPYDGVPLTCQERAKASLSLGTLVVPVTEGLAPYDPARRQGATGRATPRKFCRARPAPSRRRAQNLGLLPRRVFPGVPAFPQGATRESADAWRRIGLRY